MTPDLDDDWIAESMADPEYEAVAARWRQSLAWALRAHGGAFGLACAYYGEAVPPSSTLDLYPGDCE